MQLRDHIPGMARSKGRQVHPKGEKISVSSEERERFKKQRIAKDWDQYELANKSGISQGTISNFESGRSKQINRSVYARLYRALFGPGNDVAPNESDTWLEIVEGSVDLDEPAKQAVLTMVQQLKRRNQR